MASKAVVLAAGGFAGSNAPGAAINNSYATGNVTGGPDGYFAGFIGANGGDVTNSVSEDQSTGDYWLSWLVAVAENCRRIASDSTFSASKSSTITSGRCSRASSRP